MIAKNILVVDDDCLVIKSLEKIFKQEGYNVSTAGNGQDALRIVNEMDFDSVIIDIRMPGINGIETVSRIKECLKNKNRPDIPVVFITGYSDLDINTKAKDFGEIFLKPFDMKEFISHVKELDYKNKVTFSIVQTSKELREVISVRKKIFVKREGYPSGAITSDFDKWAIHILAKCNNQAVGAITLVLDSEKGLPIEKKFDISAWRGGKAVEIDKLAVLPEKHGSAIAFDLIAITYAISRFWGAQKVFIFTLKKKQGNIIFYKKFGFKLLGEFELFNCEPAVAMLMDFSSEDTYEKKLTSVQLLQIARKLVGMTVMGV